MNTTEKTFQATRNACKVCTPLGACVAFKGLKGCVPLIHGSQGCSTYIRRYLISHYKEPFDIASTNFSVDATIFGGGKNFAEGLDNIISQYNPEVIAICTTCLSETIGEDLNLLLNEYKRNNAHKNLPYLVSVSSPSYQGTHMDGFHEAVASLVSEFAEDNSTEGLKDNRVNLFPGFVSPEDLRYLKEILKDFDLDYVMLPDYSETLDSPTWKEYIKISPGGTSIDQIKMAGAARTSIEFGDVINKGNHINRIKDFRANETAGEFLKSNFNVENYRLSMPIGINLTDKFFELLSYLTSREIPQKYQMERGRLIDSYIDGHKYVMDKKAVLYGEEDFVISMASFLDEIGIKIILAASGGESGLMKQIIPSITKFNRETIIKEGIDFEEISELVESLHPDIIIGNSKGYYISRKLSIPLMRVGFPVHDRIGGQRILHLGYRGAQQLFDKIANTLIEYKQDNSPVGYKYM